MKIQTYTLGQLQTNCYLVSDLVSREAIIIDPADDANFLIEQVMALNFKLMSIVATHGHFDHILASWELTLAFNLPLSINEKDLPILKYMTESASYWLKQNIVEKPPENLKFIKEGDVVEFGSEKLEVRETPGHSPGSICLASQGIPLEVFTGDTLFAEGTGRIDLPYSSEKDLQLSLNKLSEYPPESIIYPGHGDSSTITGAFNHSPIISGACDGLLAHH